MKISVMITTRNRCQDLQRTLAVLTGMKPPPGEILVTADGCTDGTVEMVRADFPQCILYVNEPGRGSIPARDQMMRSAMGDVVMSFDDDSYPVAQDFFARLPELFQNHPEAMVITFPELVDSGKVESYHEVPPTIGHYVSSYSNCAAAVRRDIYLKTAGYSVFFSHAYEEPDFALQCYQSGGAVWFESGQIIRHHFSPANRSSFRTHHLNARNEFWSVLIRCPWPWLPVVSAFRVWRQFRYACSQGFSWIVREPLWWWAALRGVGHCLRQRQPVKWPVYLGWMRLARLRIETPEELRRLFQRA